jgi:hypothetical protein
VFTIFIVKYYYFIYLIILYLGSVKVTVRMSENNEFFNEILENENDIGIDISDVVDINDILDINSEFQNNEETEENDYKNIVEEIDIDNSSDKEETKNINIENVTTSSNTFGKCCICGCVKNVGQYLDKIFQNMELIGSLFDDYVIILYYDVSTDNTLQKMREYKRKNSRFMFFINNTYVMRYRTYNLAKGRNFIIKTIRERFSDYPYFIMMDCDDVCARDMKLQLLCEYLKRNDWDSLSFNHPTGYYDMWALSKYPFVMSCHHFNNGCFIYANFIQTLIKNTPRNSLIKCISAFNGFAIYRTPLFLNCNYNGVFDISYLSKKIINQNIKLCGSIIINNQSKNEDCEHRRFHYEAITKNNARIRISPLRLFK